MTRITLPHPLTYRQEVVSPLFQLVRACESVAIIGSSSMGKSNLIRFILRPDVQQHYLEDQASTILFVVADCNRLTRVSSWGLYELLLTAYTEACDQLERTLALRAEINSLRNSAIMNRSRLLAWRQLELATRILCQEGKIRLCIIFDEFDEAYRELPAQALRPLRALRDANKYQISYVLLLRDHPGRVRNTVEIEGFYELVSRSVLWLAPYMEPDAAWVLDQLEARHERHLPHAVRSRILRLSGGHPGLMLALFAASPKSEPPLECNWEEWAIANSTIREECQRLWESLAQDQRDALIQLTRGRKTTADLQMILMSKGLIGNLAPPTRLFSPIFTRFVLEQEEPEWESLRLDMTTRVVWQGERAITNLTALEFDLLAFLLDRAGQVCTREQIIASLHPHEVRDAASSTQDKRVDTLIKRIREKIEPKAGQSQPRYLITVRRKGYKVVESAKRT